MEKDAMSREVLLRDTFKEFKRNCINCQEIIQAEGITKENYPDFYSNKVQYGYPEQGEPFKLIKLANEEYYTPIDSGIADIIVYLNKRGYKTRFCCEGHKYKFCCEGHKYENYRSGYIFFYSFDKQKTSKLLEAIYKIGHSNGGNIYACAEVGDPRGIIFRFSPKNGTPHQEVMLALKEAFEGL